MQAIELEKVTSDAGVEKRPPQGRGWGVNRILGEDTANMEQGTGNRTARIGD